MSIYTASTYSLWYNGKKTVTTFLTPPQPSSTFLRLFRSHSVQVFKVVINESIKEKNNRKVK